MRAISLEVSALVVVLFEVLSDFVDHIQIVQVLVYFQELFVEWVDIMGARRDPILARIPLEIAKLVCNCSFLISVTIKAISDRLLLAIRGLVALRIFPVLRRSLRLLLHNARLYIILHKLSR